MTDVQKIPRELMTLNADGSIAAVRPGAERELIALLWDELRWRDIRFEQPPSGTVEMYSTAHGRAVVGECRLEFVKTGFVTHWRHRTASPSKMLKGAIK